MTDHPITPAETARIDQLSAEARRLVADVLTAAYRGHLPDDVPDRALRLAATVDLPETHRIGWAMGFTAAVHEAGIIIQDVVASIAAEIAAELAPPDPD